MEEDVNNPLIPNLVEDGDEPTAMQPVFFE
jgi:hypothetical protein